MEENTPTPIEEIQGENPLYTPDDSRRLKGAWRELREGSERSIQELEKGMEEFAQEERKGILKIMAALTILGIASTIITGSTNRASGQSEAKDAAEKCIKKEGMLTENKDPNQLAENVRMCIEEELSK